MSKDISGVEKPLDWPQNKREYELECVSNAFEKFIQIPSLENKEILLSLVTNNDLNESDLRGLCRFTEYEVGMLNEIYIYAATTYCSQAKLYIYEFLIDTVILQKSLNMFFENKSIDEILLDSPYMGLMPQLKLFYIAYFYFRVEKDKSFSQQLILTIKSMRMAINNNVEILDLIQAINSLIYDLSFIICSPKLAIVHFNRQELLQIFEIVINMWNSNNLNPSERPLRGVFTIALSNWVLKSRNDYNKGLLYKCVPNSAVTQTFVNKQVWMKNTKLLNDKREGVTFKSLFDSTKWMIKDWAKHINLDSEIIRYVCSFSKIYPNKKMQNKYGHNIYGYKNDRIGGLLSPIFTHEGHPFFSLVMAYDILYSSNELKEEINYIIKIIDKINITDEQKQQLLSRILSYWNLSVKDKKWEPEQERRYEIRIFSGYDYYDTEITKDFLKVKSTLFLLPDFINKENLMRERISKERLLKLQCLSSKTFLYCFDCLQSDFDFDSRTECKICHSKNVRIFNDDI